MEWAAGRAQAELCAQRQRGLTTDGPRRNKLKSRLKTTQNRSYPDGRPFVAYYDRSGVVYYPSGNVAMCVSHTDAGAYTWAFADVDKAGGNSLVQTPPLQPQPSTNKGALAADTFADVAPNNFAEDASSSVSAAVISRSPRLLAAFTPFGSGACYDNSGNLRVSCTHDGGTLRRANGTLQQNWSWNDKVRACGCQLSSFVRVWITGRCDIAVTFSSNGRSFSSNVGSTRVPLAPTRPPKATESIEFAGLRDKAQWLLKGIRAALGQGPVPPEVPEVQDDGGDGGRGDNKAIVLGKRDSLAVVRPPKMDCSSREGENDEAHAGDSATAVAPVTLVGGGGRSSNVIQSSSSSSSFKRASATTTGRNTTAAAAAGAGAVKDAVNQPSGVSIIAVKDAGGRGMSGDDGTLMANVRPVSAPSGSSLHRPPRNLLSSGRGSRRPTTSARSRPSTAAGVAPKNRALSRTISSSASFCGGGSGKADDAPVCPTLLGGGRARGLASRMCCACKTRILPTINDATLDRFLERVPASQLVALVVTGAKETPAERVLSSRYRSVQRGRIAPCKQCGGDSVRFLQYRGGGSTRDTELEARHGIGPGWVLVYVGGGGLVAVCNRFSGRGHSERDLAEEMSHCRKLAAAGRFLPRDYSAVQK